jgi:hypothetical protein
MTTTIGGLIHSFIHPCSLLISISICQRKGNNVTGYRTTFTTHEDVQLFKANHVGTNDGSRRGSPWNLQRTLITHTLKQVSFSCAPSTLRKRIGHHVNIEYQLVHAGWNVQKAKLAYGLAHLATQAKGHGILRVGREGREIRFLFQPLKLKHNGLCRLGREG